MKKSLLFLSLLVTVLSCSAPNKQERPVEKVKDSIREHSVLSVLWQQHAAEYRALCHQAFNMARWNIEIRKELSDKPFAIIADIDETVLDNSPYNGMLIIQDIEFDKNDWIEWGKLESAEAVPGAVAFFNFADSMGIEVFYISNRYDVQRAETLSNLRKLNLPNADSNHVFLKTRTSAKQERRDRVLADYEVLMYLGDNLSDFSSVFDNQNNSKRNELVEELKASFGSTFIVFPNAMYGDWESRGIYESNRDWTDQQRDSIRQAKLVTYK